MHPPVVRPRVTQTVFPAFQFESCGKVTSQSALALDAHQRAKLCGPYALNNTLKQQLARSETELAATQEAIRLDRAAGAKRIKREPGIKIEPGVK